LAFSAGFLGDLEVFSLALTTTGGEGEISAFFFSAFFNLTFSPLPLALAFLDSGKHSKTINARPIVRVISNILSASFAASGFSSPLLESAKKPRCFGKLSYLRFGALAFAQGNSTSGVRVPTHLL
jgi:hypothetical protein